MPPGNRTCKTQASRLETLPTAITAPTNINGYHLLGLLTSAKFPEFLLSLSKVVKSRQCYLHHKTNTANMHIWLNFIFKKRAYNIMKAISSEIVHLLKVKLSLQDVQRWLLLLSWFSKFSNPPPPPPPPYKILENLTLICSLFWLAFQWK